MNSLAGELTRLKPNDPRRGEIVKVAERHGLPVTFVSLLIAEGASVVEVARQAGHSPTMTLDTYAHVFEELSGTERRVAANVSKPPPATDTRRYGLAGSTPAIALRRSTARGVSDTAVLMQRFPVASCELRYMSADRLAMSTGGMRRDHDA